MMAHGAFEWKIIRKKYIQTKTKEVQWRICNYNKIFGLYDTDVLTHIKLRRLEWARHICRMDISRAPGERLEVKIHGSQPIVKPQDR